MKILGKGEMKKDQTSIQMEVVEKNKKYMK